jgi:hypothetical protein
VLTTPRQWEVRLRVSLSRDRDYVAQAFSVSIYGETVDDLREQVRNYLMRHQPSYFTNDGDHIAGPVVYAYSDGINPPPRSWIEKEVFSENDFKEQKGWWFYPRRLVAGRLKFDEGYLYPFFKGSLEDAVDDFVLRAFIPRKGPDYQSRAMVEKQLHLPLLESVLHEAEEFTLNDLLQRGWQILALEYQGEVGKTGELTNRKASFVLGHADLCAASYTLETRHQYYYYMYRWCPEEKIRTSQ